MREYLIVVDLKDEGMHGGHIFCLYKTVTYHRIGASGELTITDDSGTQTTFSPYRWLSYELRKA